MVALSPRFTFLAALCALVAISSAPISDAAVLPLRASDLASTEMTLTQVYSGATTLSDRRTSHVVDGAPVLPLPEDLGGSQKKYADSDDDHISSSSGGNLHGEKDGFSGHDTEDSTYDDSGAVSKKGGKSKVKDRRWDLFRPIQRLRESWFSDDNVNYARASHPHHPHHHHHHHDRHHRGLRTRRSEPGSDRDSSSSAVSGDDYHVHVGRSPHHHHHDHHHNEHEKVVVSGDHDHVRVDRSPRSPHHHHNEHEKVVVSGDHDHVRIDHSPRSHHHHHHQSEHEKVIVSGDDDHVHVGRSVDWQQSREGGNAIFSRDSGHGHHQGLVLIAGEQGQSYVVPSVTKRSSVQESFTVPPLEKRADYMDCAPGYIHIISPSQDGGEFLASLVLASPDSTSSDNSTTPSPAFVLNASEMNTTPMCLQASSYNTSDSALTPDEVGVTLLVEMFDAASVSLVPYCATFDPSPPAPAPLTAKECTDNPVGESQSQLFAFDRTTGALRPMWFMGQDDGTGAEGNECVGGDDHAALPNSSLDGNYAASTPETDPTDQAPASTSAVLAADSSDMAPSDSSEGSSSGAQNVALVFVAMDPVVMDSPSDASATMSSVPAAATGTEASNNALTETPSNTVMATASPVSSLSSVSASSISSTGPNTSVLVAASSGAPTSVPSSTELASGAHFSPSMMLAVQAIPASASDAAYTTSPSASPTMTPVNTQPYEWMFKLD